VYELDASLAMFFNLTQGELQLIVLRTAVEARLDMLPA
jgi:hypothetical protein